MQNQSGQNIDLYIPRKCSWTNRLIASHDHASIQINVGRIDPNTGRFIHQTDSYALCGFVRANSFADEALSTLVRRSKQRK